MQNRVTTIRQSLQRLNLTSILLSDPTSLRYVFGFTGSNGIGIITARQAIVVTDWRYRDQVRAEVENAEILIALRDPIALLKEKKVFAPRERLGIEDHHLTYREAALVKKHFPNLTIHATERLVSTLAIPKTQQEIEIMTRAAHMAVAVWEDVLPLIRSGVTEAEIAAEIIYRARKRGSTTEAFDPIVASGPRSALPHAKSSRRKLVDGDMVVVDFGCVVDGYCSDFTRTVAVGHPADELIQAYVHVKEAGEIVYHAIKQEMVGQELDKIARDYFERHGLANLFNHALGHGLGMDVHAMPRLGPKSEDTIPVHAVLAIEPGLYLPNQGGIRIEDDVLVLENGCEVLTRATRELIFVE